MLTVCQACPLLCTTEVTGSWGLAITAMTAPLAKTAAGLA
jgi:hypothetical protein